MNEATRMLAAIEQGDQKAAEDLLPLVYAELRRLAAWQMSGELPGQTLQPTALVHEAWLRLTGTEGARWENSRHFFGAAAEAMRRILIDNARRKHAVRHGGGLHRTQLNELTLAASAPDEQLLAINEALESLSLHNPAICELVKLRYFAGFTLEQAGRILGLPPRTAKRHWAYARAWLYRRITTSETGHT